MIIEEKPGKKVNLDLAFTSDFFIQDFSELGAILRMFFGACTPEDWARRTGKRPTDWTLHETLAHVFSAAEAFHQLIKNRLAGEPTAIEGLQKRSDLANWNETQINTLRKISPQSMIDQLLHTFEQAAECCSRLDEEQLALTIPMPMYNRPATIAQVMGFQLCHIGMVHAAQLANGAGVAPLWTQYSPEFMRRQITRFLLQMSFSYRVERGKKLRAGIQFKVYGKAGGNWHTQLNPDGGSSRADTIKNADLTLRFRNASALCRVFTFQVGGVRAVVTGEMIPTGDFSLLLRLGRLLIPT